MKLFAKYCSQNKEYTGELCSSKRYFTTTEKLETKPKHKSQKKSTKISYNSSNISKQIDLTTCEDISDNKNKTVDLTLESDSDSDIDNDKNKKNEIINKRQPNKRSRTEREIEEIKDSGEYSNSDNDSFISFPDSKKQRLN